MNPLVGVRLVECEWMSVPAMVPPAHRFVEYEPSDLWWLERYGFLVPGRVPDPNVMILPGAVYGHPETLARLKRNVDRGQTGCGG
jgi:hypothetical protein